MRPQFRLLSTSARCLIHGIISRSLTPTCSIGCSASLVRIALNEVWLTLFSSIQSLTKRVGSSEIFFISNHLLLLKNLIYGDLAPSFPPHDRLLLLLLIPIAV